MLRSVPAVVAFGALLLIVVYGFDVGHGFVKDDFVWILTSRIAEVRDLRGLLGSATGFFRPVVSLSFAFDHSLFGLSPLGYGLTNLALLLLCSALLMRLVRALGVGAITAVCAGWLWALNFNGINMAVLWISGRTSLLVALFAIAAAWAWVRERPWSATAFAVLAMWSKEDAFAIPAILTAWSYLDTRRALTSIRRAWPLWVAALASLAVRTWSGAYSPLSAPSYYRYQLDALTLANNLLAYADRVATTALAALLLFWLAAGAPRLHRRDPSGRDAAAPTNLIAKGMVWVVLAMVPTILLPVRSSLYAVMPSVGLMLMVADLAERIAARVEPHVLRRAAAIVAALFVALIPAYRLRNQRYVREAELSAAVVRELRLIASTRTGGGLVVIRDARDRRPTAEQSFGALADRAAWLVTNGRVRAWIEPPPPELATAPAPDVTAAVATLVVEDGAVRRLR